MSPFCIKCLFNSETFTYNTTGSVLLKASCPPSGSQAQENRGFVHNVYKLVWLHMCLYTQHQEDTPLGYTVLTPFVFTCLRLGFIRQRIATYSINLHDFTYRRRRPVCLAEAFPLLSSKPPGMKCGPLWPFPVL